MSRLGDKLRGVGQDTLAAEVDRLSAELAQEQSKSNYWYRTASQYSLDRANLTAEVGNLSAKLRELGEPA